MKRILAIGAHPDDIEYGCAGTIRRLAPEAALCVILSEGSAGDPTTSPRRIVESTQALAPWPVQVLGRAVEDVTVEDLTRAITDFSPAMIFTHTPHDTHQEHRRAYELTLSAARRSPSSICRYATPSLTPDFRPILWVNIAAEVSAKQSALAHHVSQAQKPYMSREQLAVFHGSHYARLHGFPVTEAFEIERLFL